MTRRGHTCGLGLRDSAKLRLRKTEELWAYGSVYQGHLGGAPLYVWCGTTVGKFSSSYRTHTPRTRTQWECMVEVTRSTVGYSSLYSFLLLYAILYTVLLYVYRVLFFSTYRQGVTYFDKPSGVSNPLPSIFRDDVNIYQFSLVYFLILGRMNDSSCHKQPLGSQ